MYFIKVIKLSLSFAYSDVCIHQMVVSLLIKLVSSLLSAAMWNGTLRSQEEVFIQVILIKIYQKVVKLLQIYSKITVPK
jgi:hypothetical protein